MKLVTVDDFNPLLPGVQQNSYYINIAKITSSNSLIKLENNLDYINDSLITKQIIEKYKNHPSIKAIEDTSPVKKEFKIEEAKAEQVFSIIISLKTELN